MRTLKDDEMRYAKNGEWFDIGGYPLHVCCDCALVHRIKYRIYEGKMQEAWWRDEPLTQYRRRAEKRPKKKRE